MTQILDRAESFRDRGCGAESGLLLPAVCGVPGGEQNPDDPNHYSIDDVIPLSSPQLKVQAVELGTSNLFPDIKALLSTLLATLEHDKKSLDLGEGDARYCENFALAVFGRADRADRGGSRTKATAMTFYAASIFMEILNQFGELSPENAMKQRFAAWRAADLRKAISEGREPDPPPSAELPAVSEEDEAFLDELQSMPSVPQDRAGSAPGAPNNKPLDEAEETTEDEAHVASSHAPPADAPDNLPASTLPGVSTPRDAQNHGLDLPSPPSSPPIRSSFDRGPVWTPPPPRTFHVFQKVSLEEVVVDVWVPRENIITNLMIVLSGAVLAGRWPEAAARNCGQSAARSK